MSVQEFNNILHARESKLYVNGKLRLASQGLGWKALAGEADIVTVKAEDVKKFAWLRSARSYQLRITLRDGSVKKFDNFQRENHDEVRDTIRANYHLPLDHMELSLKGWNWGETELQPHQLVFKVGKSCMFELPYADISNVYAGKNEVAVECLTSDMTRGSKEDQLVECRFHVPGMAPADNDDGVDVEGEGEKDLDGNAQSAADYLAEAIRSKADLNVEKGDNIVSFKELPFLTPRGRYDVDMFPTFLRLRGKSYDYKINYAHITNFFMMPKPDDVHVIFVVGLDPPLRQGQTRYPFLVLQFVREDEMMVDLNLDDPAISDQLKDRLQRNYDAPTFEVVSAIFRGLADKKITVPGTFRASSGAHGIKCSLKANEGYIYVLEKSLLFVPKPATLMAHGDISHVTFSRVSGQPSRTIDLVFSMRHGADVSLSNISREEYTGLEDYFKTKKIKVKNELNEETRLPYLGDLDDDEDDEDAKNGRRPAARKARGAAANDKMDMDDEESPDEDFIDESDSDVAEEYNSDYSSVSGSDAEESKASSAKRRHPKEAGARSTKKAKVEAPVAGSSKSKVAKTAEHVEDSDDD